MGYWYFHAYARSSCREKYVFKGFGKNVKTKIGLNTNFNNEHAGSILKFESQHDEATVTLFASVDHNFKDYQPWNAVQELSDSWTPIFHICLLSDLAFDTDLTHSLCKSSCLNANQLAFEGEKLRGL